MVRERLDDGRGQAGIYVLVGRLFGLLMAHEPEIYAGSLHDLDRVFDPTVGRTLAGQQIRLSVRIVFCQVASFRKRRRSWFGHSIQSCRLA